MKNLIILAALAIGLFACTTGVDNKNNENIDLIKNYIQAVENIDFDAMDSYLAEDYLGVGPSYGDSIGKADAVNNWKWNVETLYEKIHYNRSRFAAVYIPDGENKGNWVSNWAELNIVYKDWQGEVTIWANTNYLVENGKIAKSITFYNEADALRQLGFKFVLSDTEE